MEAPARRALCSHGGEQAAMSDPYLQLATVLRKLDPTQLRLTGLMTKCDPRGRNWTRRCFVLRGACLEYYKCQKADWENGELKGRIDTAFCQKMGVKNKGRTFQISLSLEQGEDSRAYPQSSNAFHCRSSHSEPVFGLCRGVQDAVRVLGGVPGLAGEPCRDYAVARHSFVA